ncbi:unnamed protein product [Penicillium olsonii]|uniref:DUF3669 domain-containing protein n=1 Tax=Penicillium olsonii TaxID=99116 RepID=A0A9W4MVU8_PENOL|nr:unnamed protein product [Penicillium olsonii]CAG8213025.1 unnamed protein product [Penicillium olsonii]
MVPFLPNLDLQILFTFLSLRFQFTNQWPAMSERCERDSSELPTGSDATVILERTLSLRSVISTTSSFSQLAQTSRNRPHLQQINQIGAGSQGVVFERAGKDSVLKKERPGNEILSSNLTKEYTIHRRVSAAFDHYQPLTKCETIVPKGSTALEITVLMQRILPLPKVVRRALIHHFITADIPQASALLADPRNKHCLARVYLGKENGALSHESPLRNFPLYLDDMKRIGIDTIELTSALGKAYATLHWGAGVNGDDIEFVLGTTVEQAVCGRQPHEDRAIGLFLLDFGQCDIVDLSQESGTVYQAFKGAMLSGDNQHFIPHANQPELFAAFKKGYSAAGTIILGDKRLDSKFDMKEFVQQYEEYAEDFVS